jgi:hypothetical protein
MTSSAVSHFFCPKTQPATTRKTASVGGQMQQACTILRKEMAWPRAVSGKCCSDAARPFLGVSSLNSGGVLAPPILSRRPIHSTLLTQHTVR